jgi:uncharacterized protein involved in exopolysaccharide biosynthesis
VKKLLVAVSVMAAALSGCVVAAVAEGDNNRKN